jgi:hypothetical protein
MTRTPYYQNNQNNNQQQFNQDQSSYYPQTPSVNDRSNYENIAIKKNQSNENYHQQHKLLTIQQSRSIESILNESTAGKSTMIFLLLFQY